MNVPFVVGHLRSFISPMFCIACVVSENRGVGTNKEKGQIRQNVAIGFMLIARALMGK
jgi:hypothetical protein